MQTVSIVGIGRMGGALAIALYDAGYQIENLVVRSPEAKTSEYLPVTPVALAQLDQITSDIIFITTGDQDISKTCSDISHLLKKGTVVLHTSGLLDSSELSSASSRGCYVGSMHPLISVSDALSGSREFRDANFCIEGDETGVNTAQGLVESLGGRSFTIPSSSKPLYHASAVMAAGNTVALFDMAVEMMNASGVEPDMSRQLLLRLLQSVVSNLSNKMPGEALTGSFARGDATAVDKHLTALKSTVSKEIQEVFVLLGERSVDIALKNNSHLEGLKIIRERLNIAKNDLQC